MRFAPQYTFNLLTESDFDTQIHSIYAQLDRCRQAGVFRSFDRQEIYYEYFLAEGSTASVVILHGLSEFTKKYYELTHCLLEQGFNVFLYDQRGHGLSCRLTDRQDLIHVDRFEDYTLDLEQFIRQIVRPADEKPLYLFAHSMGGAVALSYLRKHPDVFQKAVLSAPMLLPDTGKVPAWLARFGVAVAKTFRGPKAKFPGSRDFDPDYPFHIASDASFARFSHHLQLRRQECRYQTSPMTLGWVHGSLKLHRKLLRAAGHIHIPVLLLSAQLDRVVRNDLHRRFAQRCQSCTLVTVPQAKHGLLSGSETTRYAVFRRTVDHFQH